MGTNPRVRELLAIWDQAPPHAKPSVAELCANDPQLLREVERYIRARLSPAAHTTAAPPPEQDPDGVAPPPPAHARAKHGISVSAIEGYRLVRELGRGGQAVVYEAVQKSTTRRVAIKVLTAGRFAGPQERRRLEREAQVLAALNHPNVVQVIDRGVTKEGFYYLVMGYVVGRPLNEWFERQHKTPAGDAPPSADDATPTGPLPLFLKICSAVNAAHLRGIVHRDLKPGNILVDEAGEPHVLDFGLARAGLPDSGGATAEPITITGQFLGSLPWASPEQAEGMGSQIDTRSDVYSLGVILYQLLTGGHFPYKVVGTMREVLDNIMRADPVPPSKVLAPNPDARRPRHLGRARRLPQVNPSIEAIVLKALSKRREDRYQTAGELAREIENYLAGRPILAAPPRGRIRAARWVVAASIAMVVAFVASVLLVSALRDGSRDRRADHAARRAGAEPSVSVPPPLPTSVPTTAGDPLKEPASQPAPIPSTQPDAPVAQHDDFIVAASRPTDPSADATELAATRPAEQPRRDYVHPGGRTVELLPLINPALDAPPWGRDKWRMVDGELVAAAEGGANMRVPYVPPAEYDYVVEFTRKGGPDSVGMIFPNPTKPESVRWIMGGTGNEHFGLTKVNGLTLGGGIDNPTQIERTPALHDGRRYKAVVQVRKDRVRAYLDDEQLCDFPTDYANLSDPHPIGASDLGLVTWGCAAVFHRVAVIEVEGEGKPLRPSATTAPSDYLPPEGTVVELLPLVNLRADVHQLSPPGPEPVLRNGELHMPGTRGVVELPYLPSDEYDFLVEFTRTAGTRQVIQDCPHPLGHGHVNWTLNMGFGKVDGKMPHEPENPTHVRRERGSFTNNVRHQSIVQLRRGEIRAYLDGRLVSAYKTDYRDITQPGPRRDPSRLGVYSENNDIVFHRLAVTEVTGKGQLLRVPPKSTTRPSGYVPPPGKLIDLLAMLRRGSDQQAEARKWQLRAAGLVIAAAEPARDVPLPYNPTGSYDLLIEFTQRSGSVGFNQNLYIEENGRNKVWHINGPGGECALFGGPTAEVLRVVLPAPLKLGTRHVSIVQVRPNDFRAYLDGQLIFRRRPLPGVTYGVKAPAGGRGALGLHVGNCEIVIHRAAVLEVAETADPPAAARRAGNAERNADR